MTSDRIKEIQEETAYPNSVSVMQALLKVWNECEQENKLQNDADRKRFFTTYNVELMQSIREVKLKNS